MLARHVLTRDADVEDFRDHLNSLFYPARVRPLNGSVAGSGELRGARTEHVAVGLMRFGQDMSVDPEWSSAYYHVNIVLSGTVVAEAGEHRCVGTPDVATVFTPRYAHRLLHCGGGAEQIGVKIDRDLLDDELESLLGRPPRRPLEFDVAFPLTAPVGRSWHRALRLLIEELDDDGLIATSAMRTRYERLLASGLLLGHRHNHSAVLAGADGIDGPAWSVPVRAVVDLIQARPEDQYTLGRLAQVAGVSARRLQEGFREQIGRSPMAYLTEVRLDRVRRDLRAGTAPVTETARHWGFTHLGRFSGAYRARFGENPSQTLARARPR
ncbi:AraC family transcriptional regulator [Pseudonocardia nematodicida]|uniref:AraC family transcriptional regulator n=1 Tax=Pseudonocardia nematodicida TaxID=1206997 RepID=A0ABV1KFL3_9PSEU